MARRPLWLSFPRNYRNDCTRERLLKRLRNWSEAAAEAVPISRKLVARMRKNWNKLFKMCTISWLTCLLRPLQIVGYGTHENKREHARNRWLCTGIAVVIGLLPISSFAEDKIQAF